MLLPFLQCGFGAKYERAHHARGTASTIDEGQVVLGDLALPCPSHHLPGGFNDVPKTTGAANRLASGYLTAIGIDRKTAFVGGVDRIVKRANLPFLTEAGIFEAHGREDGISIIHFGELHLLRSIAGHLKRLTSGDGDRGGGDSGTLPDHIVIGDTRAGTQ